MTTTTTTSSQGYSQHIPLAEKACAFLTASPDPFHAVANSVAKLQQAGFVGLDPSTPFCGQIVAGGKYYYTVQHSALVGFTVGPSYQAGQACGFHMIGGHTDSPNLKIKPRSLKGGNGSGCTMLGVECYGGGLWHTWFDRDLGVSGKVLLRKPNGKIQQQLVQLSDPIARISTLCIHLQSAEERQGFAVNKEQHTAPMIGTAQSKDAGKLLEQGAQEQLNQHQHQHHTPDAWRDGHEPLLLQAIATKLNVDLEEICDFELNLYDTQPASLGGISKEFLYSARLDNLATVFCAIESLVDYASDLPVDSNDVSLVVAFDHEEVGSTSAPGAGSPIMEEAIQRISTALQHNNNDNKGETNAMTPDLYAACIRKSFILSIDQAHALHPNYASKHEPVHAPLLNAGVVIKTNSNQRYATNGMTGFVVRELGRRANIPIQEFVVKNDCPCGSTIGPTISAKTGIRTVDAGMPQLSMHSVREVMGIADCKSLLCCTVLYCTVLYYSLGVIMLFCVFLLVLLLVLYSPCSPCSYFLFYYMTRACTCALHELPSLSHNIIAMTVTHGLELFKSFFHNFRALDDEIGKDLHL
jgi:aspartyl aminopeptidase